jgi:outer membrane protein
MARWGIAVSIGLVVAGMGVCPAGSRAQTVGKIGFVNTTVILRQTPGYNAADSTITAMRARFQQEADELQSQLASAVTNFDQQDLTLNPQTREGQLDSLQGLNDRIQTRLQEMQNQVLERQRELITPLEQRIGIVIDGVRAERGLAVVFDAANPNAGILSADPSLDLTAFVISRLQGSGTP